MIETSILGECSVSAQCIYSECLLSMASEWLHWDKQTAKLSLQIANVPFLFPILFKADYLKQQAVYVRIFPIKIDSPNTVSPLNQLMTSCARTY